MYTVLFIQFRSHARAHRALHLARLTLDLTAPVKLAVAVLLLHNVPGVVPPPATQDITTLFPQGGRVADPPVRPWGAQGEVGQAELGRLLGVDQIDPPRRLYGFPLRYEAVAVIASYDLCRAVEPLLEPIPDFPERRHFPPARPKGAGSRQAVALALCPHMVLDCLKADPPSSLSPWNQTPKLTTRPAS